VIHFAKYKVKVNCMPTSGLERAVVAAMTEKVMEMFPEVLSHMILQKPL